MNIPLINNTQFNMNLNSFPSQQCALQNNKTKNNSSKKMSLKKQLFPSMFVDQLPMQMPIQQSYQNQQLYPINPLAIPQAYNTISSSITSQIESMVSTTHKKRLHPKSKFTPSEDQKLRDLVARFGDNDWANVSKMMGTRNQRQCRERWTNYLSPNVCFAPWTPQEDDLLKKLHEEIGAKWVKISSYFPNRTDTNIKNRWMVLQRQKKAIENSNKNKGEELKQEQSLFAEKDSLLQAPAHNLESLNEDQMILSFEADTQIDLMEDITSSNLMSADSLFDLNWM